MSAMLGAQARPVFDFSYATDGEAYSLVSLGLDPRPAGRQWTIDYGPVAGVRLRDGASLFGGSLWLEYASGRVVGRVGASLLSPAGARPTGVLQVSLGFRF
ncbi:MAG: hypothetical protein KF884_10735 [Fimbriimonadaceae bacterium]|nr:hypothetical protein [Fimbriimonadaceae bacterium]QYK58022.1 MAG: hypothetical protein KF884_10735 [Fimbriimonadaceae bacterium]